MISQHFRPIERGGFKWDAGCILFEFDALREPEKTQFPKIGDYLHSLGIEFNEVIPKMLWCGHIVPDLYIANQLDAVPSSFFTEAPHKRPMGKLQTPKAQLPDLVNFEWVSETQQGKDFHETFIEPMCQKIAGIPAQEVIARYHRSLWLPLYWPETLKEKKNLNTRFWYPKKGYAGVVAENHRINSGTRPPTMENHPEDRKNRAEFDAVELTLTFILAKPTQPFQTLFVVDKSPIYRITNMDACAGLTPDFHRFVVESRAYCQDIGDEAQRLNLLSGIQYSTQLKIKMPLPTLANYQRGWRPAPHLNQQLWEMMNATAGA